MQDSYQKNIRMSKCRKMEKKRIVIVIVDSVLVTFVKTDKEIFLLLFFIIFF